MSGSFGSMSQRFLKWWRKPLKLWERVLLCAAAFLYFGVISSVVGLLFGGVPILPANDLFIGLAKWGMPAALIGCVLAYYFPRAVLCIIYPLSMFGVGDVEIT
jgi:hypothetical protein